MYLLQLVLLFLAFLFSSNVIASSFSHYSLYDGDNEIHAQSNNIRILDTVLLDNSKVNGLKTDELSDISWDANNQLLYAVSDEGKLFHIKLSIDNQRISHAEIINAYRLKNKKGKKLKKKSRDSEGLAIQINKQGDTELLISFEHKQRIRRYSVNGEYIGKVKLPDFLKNKDNFQHKNKGLESVTIHPVYGILTASEKPLKTTPKNTQAIYASDGNYWYFPESIYKESSITSIETMPNGDILILERAWQGIPYPIHISLRQLQLTNCASKSKCHIKELAHFSTADGWRLDNFEGLTHYKDNLYLMISDNNEHPLQNTLLVFFEVLSRTPPTQDLRLTTYLNLQKQIIFYWMINTCCLN